MRRSPISVFTCVCFQVKLNLENGEFSLSLPHSLHGGKLRGLCGENGFDDVVVFVVVVFGVVLFVFIVYIVIFFVIIVFIVVVFVVTEPARRQAARTLW